MKYVSVLTAAVLACFVMTSQSAMAGNNGPMGATLVRPKAKTVRIEFDGRPNNHRLSRVEIAERAAYIRHLKRLRAMYTQPMPELQ